MGCNSSAEGVENSVVPVTAIVPTASPNQKTVNPAAKVGPSVQTHVGPPAVKGAWQEPPGAAADTRTAEAREEASTQATLAVDQANKLGKPGSTPKATEAMKWGKPGSTPKASGLCPLDEFSRAAPTVPAAPSRQPANGEGGFPVPLGWKVVCRLSPDDVRSRWGSRPRPGNRAARATAAGTAFEVDLAMPELSKPLRLPLQLLPQWVDPCVGAEFLKRYEVKRGLKSPIVALQGEFFEVYDLCDQTESVLFVCNLKTEVDVKRFVQRLQLESLDSERRLFLRLHEVALALPGRLAVTTDIPRRSLWQEFDHLEPARRVAKVAAIANAVLGGLCRLHACGFAHCGVSPHTICLALDGAWKLTGLEGARQVRDLKETPSVLEGTGAAVAPETLLGLPATEKIDVWQLAVALCEAVTRRRICAPIDGGGTAEQMCALIDFLGPLPAALVAQHPQREEFFTPEGHVLRPATPSNAGDAFEAIEPVKPSSTPGAQAAVAHGSGSPRPRHVAEALGSAEGAGDVLEFLGRLLNPDPEQRPSAREAMAHHFLRSHNKYVFFSGLSEVAMVHQVKVRSTLATGKYKTGAPTRGIFQAMYDHIVQDLALSDEHLSHEEEEVLPLSKTEAEDEDSEEANRLLGGRLSSAKSESAKCSRCAVATLGGKQARFTPEILEVKYHAASSSTGGAPETVTSQVVRKRRSIVAPEDMVPLIDPEKKSDKVQFSPAAAAAGAQQGGSFVRKGTGFVHSSELPESDDEDDDDDEDDSAEVATQGHVLFQDRETGEGSTNSLVRKGTGFVHVGELPPSDSEDEDEEDEEDPRRVKIQEAGGEANYCSNIVRRGTGFVHVSELPPSDDEDDDEEVEEVPARAPKGVKFVSGPAGDDGGAARDKKNLARKGTAFAGKGELPPSDDEDEDDNDDQEVMGVNKSANGVKFQEPDPDDDQAGKEGGVTRKGTGFVHVNELPDFEDDDEDDEDEEDARGAAKAGHVHIQDDRGDNVGTLTRKGTGFVHVGELPPSDDEDEDDDDEDADGRGSRKPEHVQIQDNHGDNENKLVRKGTGFVHISELPPSDDEDEDEDEEEEPAPKPEHVKIEDSAGDNENKLVRKGTGFVHVSELPPSDDEDEDEDDEEEAEREARKRAAQNVKIKESGGPDAESVCGVRRKGTGFVHIGELPPSDDEDDDEDEEEDGPARGGHVKIQDSHGDNENKLTRKGTGFVHVGELPPSDDEDEDDDEDNGAAWKADHVKIQDVRGDNENKIVRKGTGFVHISELPPSDDEDEDEDEEEDLVKKPEHVKIEDNHGDNENKLVRKGTGFIHVHELPPSDDEDEDEDDEDDEPARKNERVTIKEGDCGEKESSHLVRKGTGFVHVSELPSSDDEDDEDDEE